MERIYQVHCGFVDKCRSERTHLFTDHIRATEFTANSLKSAQTKSNQFARKQADIEARFAYESPKWSKVYDVPQPDGSLKRNGMTRMFVRDVHQTGRDVYIHLTWWLEDGEESNV